MNNWLILGLPGSGKSTFSTELAKNLNLVHVELDDYVWEPKWKEVSDQELNSRLTQELNRSKRDIILEGVRVDKISVENLKRFNNVVILDINPLTCVRRSTKRNFKRLISGEKICGQNKETLASFTYSFFSAISMFPYQQRVFREVVKHMSASDVGVCKVLKSEDDKADFLQEIL